jgi:hypothetical protein
MINYFNKTSILDRINILEVDVILAFDAAIIHNQIECLKYLIKNVTLDEIKKCNTWHTTSPITFLAVKHRKLDCVKLLLEHDHGYDIFVLKVAIKNNDFECLKYILDNHKFSFSIKDLVDTAIKYNFKNTKMIKYLHAKAKWN